MNLEPKKETQKSFSLLILLCKLNSALAVNFLRARLIDSTDCSTMTIRCEDETTIGAGRKLEEGGKRDVSLQGGEAGALHEVAQWEEP